jgi:hypothetical protein
MLFGVMHTAVTCGHHPFSGTGTSGARTLFARSCVTDDARASLTRMVSGAEHRLAGIAALQAKA